ncbi:TIGR03016 family PEP-CTERM system-associated outer membrane protein [Congregibacter variabilis]|uniref:TIGR03016 family PEP-CTERM system-associated outer membrane protein n=1 Tax=Congregibacter variabilis TaxID=3081200 RepID=A0ABZ0I7N4_9GAMM|nr:TIGR03016 family PEP-CTERM system-associated outer membrane protein [Congregibacter sp. IMCC43200]
MKVKHRKSAGAALPRATLAAVAASLSLLGVAQALAGDWQTTSSVAVGVIVSDNLCLSPSDPVSDVIGTATPTVNVRGEGGRLRMGLNASAEFNTLELNEIDCSGNAGGGQFANRQSFIPRGAFNLEFDAVDSWLVLRSSASASQNAINPLAPGGEDNINGLNNTNTTYRYGVGATAERPLPRDLYISATVDYDEQVNRVGLIGDTTQETASFRFGQQPAASRLSIGVGANYTLISFEDRIFNGPQPEGLTENELLTMEMFGAFQVTRSLALNAKAGEEDNTFLSQSGDIDGSFWDLGFSWNPNSRLTIDVGYGERFYGENPRASVLWRHKRSNFRAEWQQNVNFPRNIRGLPISQQQELDVPLPGDPLGSDGIPTFVTQGAVQVESVTLRYSFDARRTNFDMFATSSDQQRFVDGSTLKTLTVGVSARRRLGKSLSLNGNVTWLDNEGDGGAFSGGRRGGLRGWQAGLGLEKTLGIRTSLSVRYSYRDQESVNFGEFTENRVQLSLRYRFL